MARCPTPDGADHHAALFAFLDELLEGVVGESFFTQICQPMTLHP